MSTRKKDPRTFKMMLVTLAAVCGLVAVIIFAFHSLSGGKTGQHDQEETGQISSSQAAEENGEGLADDAFAEVAGQETEAEASSDLGEEVMPLIQGDPTSSNPYGRVSRLAYTKTIRYRQEDIEALDADGLRITKAEILGRHGRIFNDQNIQDYFEDQSWYHARYTAQEFDENSLNEVEKYNLELLAAAEQTVFK